jgi:hypothetical protein
MAAPAQRNAGSGVFSMTTNRLTNGFLGIFACLMIYGSYRHQLIFDEAQAWVIARDSHGLADLFQHLRYEGHPALWYLLLYAPAHLSGSVIWMKVIHCASSIVMGWLVARNNRMPRAVRILIIFSAYPLLFIGVFVRSYVLAALLLILAARCLFPQGRRHHWPGMLALALAINTHFLAIPIALGIFFWACVLVPGAGIRKLSESLKERRFWISVGILFLALAICYLAVKPPSDVLPRPGIAPFRDLVLAMGREIWRFFVPFSWVLPPLAERLWISIALVALGLVGVFALPTRRARLFMISVTIAWTIVEWLTAHSPSFLHASFVFVTYIVSLILVDPEEWSEFRNRNPQREQLLQILLVVQVLTGLMWFSVDLTHLTSAGKFTAAYITESGLANRPLVVEPDLIGPAILAQARIPSAYYPACRCEGSFIKFRNDRDAVRHVTRQEIETLRSRYNSDPILIVSRLLPDPDREGLGLRLLYASPHGWMSPAEDALVYGVDEGRKP